MTHTSWGPGWPHCETRGLLTFTAGGRRWTLRREAVPIFRSFIDQIVHRGYVISDGQLDDWSFNCRAIAGTRIASNHSWGLAVDVNSLTNPMTLNGRLVTDVPSWVVQCAAVHGLRWGGNYTGAKKDPMHFEWVGTLPEAVAKAAAIVGATAAQPKDNFMPALTPDEQRELLTRVRNAEEKATTASLLAASTDQRCARLETSVHGTDQRTKGDSLLVKMGYLCAETIDGVKGPMLDRVLRRFGASP